MKFLAPAATALALAFGAAAPQAHAALVTYQYTAVGVAGTDSAGATVTGSFGFDTTAPDLNGLDYQGLFDGGFLNALVSGGVQSGLQISLTSQIWQTSNAGVGGTTDAFYNLYSPSSLFLLDDEGTALDDDALPGALALADFSGPNDDRALRLYDAANGQHAYQLTALWRDSVTQRVPEPGTGVLLAAAGLALVWAQRRRPQPPRLLPQV
jgi:hypothetical protein